MDIELLKYPVGKYTPPRPIEEDHLSKWKSVIDKFPEKLNNEVSELTDEALAWQYRPNGWTIREVVHHCADSHMNAFIRFKLALSEDNPTILAYKQKEWSMMADVTKAPVSESLIILQGLHSRWGLLLENMTSDDFKKTYFHPEHNHSFTLGQATGLYAWHSSHHLSHVKQAIHYQGKF